MPNYPDSKAVSTTRIPPDGRKGQVLTKASDNDYHVKWSSTGGGGGSGCDCTPLSIIEIIQIMEGNTNG